MLLWTVPTTVFYDTLIGNKEKYMFVWAAAKIISKPLQTVDFPVDDSKLHVAEFSISVNKIIKRN